MMREKTWLTYVPPFFSPTAMKEEKEPNDIESHTLIERQRM